jgi:hypothetical protein
MSNSSERFAHDITELAADVLWCRSFGHAWTNHARAAKGSGGGYAFTLICRRCGTQKFFQWTRRGGRRPAGYAYPDKYLAKFPIDAEVRAEIEVQALVEAGILPASAVR